MPRHPSPSQVADEHRIDDGIDAAYLAEQHDPVERAELRALCRQLFEAERNLTEGNNRVAVEFVRGARRRAWRLYEMNQSEDAAHSRMRARNRDYGYEYVRRTGA